MVRLEERGNRVGVESDQAGDEGLRISDDDALADQGVGAQPVFEHGRGDVLASGGDDELLLATGDRQVAIGIELADVAGVQETVVVDGLLGRGLVAPVAAQDVRTADQHLAVLGDPDRRPRDRPPDRSDPDRMRQVDARAPGGLGEAVALADGDADTAEEVAEPRAERSAAADRVRDVAAEQGRDLGVDQPVEKRVLGLQQRGDAPGLQRLAVLDGDVLGLIEDAALDRALGVSLGVGAVEDLLEDAGDGQHERRLEDGEVGQQVLDVGGVAEHDPLGDASDLDQPGEDVCQRKEEQGRRALDVKEPVQAAGGRRHVEDEAAMGQLAALGTPGGAAGVDDRRQGVAAQRRATGLDL